MKFVLHIEAKKKKTALMQDLDWPTNILWAHQLSIVALCNADSNVLHPMMNPCQTTLACVASILSADVIGRLLL